MELELSLDPDDAPRLTRLAALAPLRSGRARTRAVRIVWHDSPDRALAQQGLALAEQRPMWRLERLLPNSEAWPPGAPAPVLATGRAATALGHELPEPLLPMAAFEGRATSLTLATNQGQTGLTLLNGAVRAVADQRRVSRVQLEGSAEALEPLALTIAEQLQLSVPRASLAAEAFTVASGLPTSPRHEGAPELPKEASVAQAFAYVVGHLADVALYFAPLAAEGRDGPEPVHQMRVAVRRLRSAIKVFLSAVHCPSVDAADAGLKALGKKLAPTRDWDVFVTETVAPVTGSFSDEPRLQRLVSAAERRRKACHDELREFLASQEFRRLGIELACLAGGETWQASLGEAEQAELATSLDAFAAQVLSKRLKKLVEIEDDPAMLTPPELHAIRLNAKRLRYAAEIFEPLYSGKAANRFIRRLSRLQDRLGTLNDAAVAAHLLGELPGGSNHAFAGGLVLGFLGAHGGDAREGIDKEWQKFRRLEPFWE